MLVKSDLEIMRNIIPMSNVSNPSKWDRRCKFCFKRWQTRMDLANNKHFLELGKKKVTEKIKDIMASVQHTEGDAE